MKTRKSSSRNRRFNAVLFSKHWAGNLVITSVLLVLIATLFPFNFTPNDLSFQAIFRSFFSHPSSLNDLVGNVILFLPFGFGLADLTRQKGFNHLGAVLIGSVVSSTLSLTVETLQVFLPSRSSSVIDIYTNTTGGLLGAIAFLIWQATAPGRSRELSGFLRQWFSKRTLSVAIVLWVMFTALIVFNLQQAVTFRNWDTEFPLLLGNERTGDRPWAGTISTVEISDRASSLSEVADIFQHQGFASPESLVTAYRLKGQEVYSDQTGHLPDLVWIGSSKRSEEALLTSKHWLSTQKPARVLAEKLKATSEFTLSTIVATSDPTQSGPARIISLSGDSFQRNFTLGQEKTNLVFRLRTPITGINGTNAVLSVPDVFSDTKLRHLVLTYKRQILNLYVDNVQQVQSLQLTPDVTLFRYLLPFEAHSIDLTRTNIFIYRVLFYAAFFIPLGFLTAFLILRSKGSLSVQFLLFVSGVVVPAVLTETLLRGSSFNVSNLMISTMVATFSLLLVKARLSMQ